MKQALSWVGAMLVSGATWAQPVVLKFASFEPSQAPFTARVFTTWAEDVTNDSNGTLKIEIFAGGTLGRNPLQQLKLIQDGVADIAWTIPGYTPGRFDDTEVVELPFLVNNSLEGSTVLTRMLQKDQLAEWNFVATFKIDEVAQHHMALPLGGTAVMVPMLKSRYDALPPAARAAIDKHSGEAFVKRFAAVADGQITAVPEAIAKRGKNTIVHPDPATQDAFRKAVQPVSEEWRKSRPRNERVYQLFVEELARVRAGK